MPQVHICCAIAVRHSQNPTSCLGSEVQCNRGETITDYSATQHQTVASTKVVLGSISVNFANRCNIFAKELPSLFGVSAEITCLGSWLVIIMILCSALGLMRPEFDYKKMAGMLAG